MPRCVSGVLELKSWGLRRRVGCVWLWHKGWEERGCAGKRGRWRDRKKERKGGRNAERERREKSERIHV
jgi:hypothetical protein